MKHFRLGATAMALLILTSCGKDISTPFRALSERLAKYCQPDATGKYVESPVKIGDSGPAGEHVFAEGGGCLLRPIQEAWAASRQNEAFAWARSNLVGVDVIADSQAAYHYEAKHEAGPAIFKVKWTMQWVHTVLEGTAVAPSKVQIEYQKIYGTSHIPYWHGTIMLESLTPQVTAMSMRDELEADQSDVNNSIGSVTDVLAKLRSLSGQKLTGSFR